MWRNATGLLTRGSLPRRLPGPRASDVVAGERLPSQRRDRPGFAPGSLTAFLCVGRAYQRTVFGSVCWPLAREAEGRALYAGSFYEPDVKLEILHAPDWTSAKSWRERVAVPPFRDSDALTRFGARCSR